MDNDPLDAVFLTPEQARELSASRRLERLADYLEKMPSDLKPLFRERFTLVKKVSNGTSQNDPL